MASSVNGGREPPAAANTSAANTSSLTVENPTSPKKTTPRSQSPVKGGVPVSRPAGGYQHRLYPQGVDSTARPARRTTIGVVPENSFTRSSIYATPEGVNFSIDPGKQLVTLVEKPLYRQLNQHSSPGNSSVLPSPPPLRGEALLPETVGQPVSATLPGTIEDSTGKNKETAEILQNTAPLPIEGSANASSSGVFLGQKNDILVFNLGKGLSYAAVNDILDAIRNLRVSPIVNNQQREPAVYGELSVYGRDGNVLIKTVYRINGPRLATFKSIEDLKAYINQYEGDPDKEFGYMILAVVLAAVGGTFGGVFLGSIISTAASGGLGAAGFVLLPSITYGAELGIMDIKHQSDMNGKAADIARIEIKLLEPLKPPLVNNFVSPEDNAENSSEAKK